MQDNINQTGSISLFNKRYTNDMYLKRPNNDELYLYINSNLPTITNISGDWSIGFWFTADAPADTCILDTRVDDVRVDTTAGFALYVKGIDFDKQIFELHAGKGVDKVVYTFLSEPSQILYTKRWNFVTISFKQSVQKFSFSVNGLHFIDNKDVVMSFSPALTDTSYFFKYADGLILSGNTTGLRNFFILNKQINTDEILDIYQTLQIPITCHSSCILYYPFNQFPFLDTGGKFKPDEIVFLDSSYMFRVDNDITETTPAYASPFFTLNNLGIYKEQIGINSKELMFANFYTQKTSDIYPLNMNGNWINNFMNWNTKMFNLPNLTGSDFSNGYSIVIEGDFKGNSPDLFGSGYVPTSNCVLNASNINVRMDGINNFLVYNLTQEEQLEKNFKSIIITADTGGIYRLFLNGKQVALNSKTYTPLPLQEHYFGVSVSNRNYKYHEGFYIFDKTLTENEISDSIKEPKKYLALLPRVAYCLRMQGNQIKNESTFPHPDTTSTGAVTNAKDLIDVKTHKPIPEFGIEYLHPFKVLGFNPTKERGYTILMFTKNTSGSFNVCGKTNVDNNDKPFAFSINTSSASQFFWGKNTGVSLGLNTKENFKYNLYTGKAGNGQVYASWFDSILNTEISANVSANRKNGQFLSATHLLEGFDDKTDDFRIFGNHLGEAKTGDIILALMIYKGVLNDREIKEIINDGNFKFGWDITPYTKSELVLCPDFKNAYMDSTDVKIPDLSPLKHVIVSDLFTNFAEYQGTLRLISDYQDK
jgi:hypothetical protein